MTGQIDLHIHTTFSDGTDTPEELLGKLKEAGISIFAITDHDVVAGSLSLEKKLSAKDPTLIKGVELSCKDEVGKYHILGYGYDPQNAVFSGLIEKAGKKRIQKVRGRLQMLEQLFGFSFTREEVAQLLSLPAPGKPHIGDLMVKKGYASTKDEAITKYINEAHFPQETITPREVIGAITASGGVAVLAHPHFGSGSQYVQGEPLRERIAHLRAYGLMGLETFYSRNTPELIDELCGYAEEYDLYITCGSDYHGTKKRVVLGETHYHAGKLHPRLRSFLERVCPGIDLKREG